MTRWWEVGTADPSHPAWQVLVGDVRTVLPSQPDGEFHSCVTSPPYYGLRDYGHDGQIGLEPTPDEYVGRLVEVFREVRRVLREDGTLWLNLGDSYATSAGHRSFGSDKPFKGPALQGASQFMRDAVNDTRRPPDDLKPKDLIGIPWRVAFALQADGWYLRQDIIWHKPNPMPESVTDRCTKAHEYVFLLSKSARYYYDQEAVKEPATHRSPGNKGPTKGGREYAETEGEHHRTAANLHNIGARETRNRRSVWTITTKPYAGAHFAVMPPDLAEPCILAGCPAGGRVLDPFAGSGTVGMVATKHGRSFTGIELNPAYADLARNRIQGSETQP